MAEKSRTAALQRAEQLSQGFAALSGEYHILFERQRQLELKLSWAKQQYLDFLKRFTPDTLSLDHRAFLRDLEHTAAEQPCTSSDWIEHIAQSDDEDRRRRAALIRQAALALTPLQAPAAEAGVKIWSGPSADTEKSAHGKQLSVNMSMLEKDFTTAGTPSRLGCPFASSTKQSPLVTPHSSTSHTSLKGRRSKRMSFNDPIKAEICGNDVACASATSPSVEGSAAVCPIRFLHQHAPEEVAKYVEKHKHELPRSHEVCISRFQSNAESVQQLDRKYGDMVSMIQGLGEKHQAWLPEEPEESEGVVETEVRTDPKVEKWATAVTASLGDHTPGRDEEPDQAVDEARTAHFDRPMKEIRVGESPSRPWGISIPTKYTDAASSSSVGSARTAPPPLPLETKHATSEALKQTEQPRPDLRSEGGGSKARKLGPDARSMREPEHETEVPVSSLGSPASPQPETQPEPTEPKRPRQRPPQPETPKIIPQLVFNGPVFLGYPPDQLINILQHSNLGAAVR